MSSQSRPMSTLVRFLFTLVTALSILAPLAEAKGRSRSSTGSKLAKGVIIAVVVVAIVGIILFCLAVFCILRCLRARKGTKTNILAPPHPIGETKGTDLEGQNYYAQNNTGTPAPYGQPGQPAAYNTPPYDPNANPNNNQYGAHQNEYNAGYNNTGYNAGYNAGSNTGYYNNNSPQPSYAPPTGPPSMPVPPTGQY